MEHAQLAAHIGIQIALGISLAACAGLRAFLPLLVMGILVRTGYLGVNESFHWMGATPTLIVFGVATLVEILGDKFPSVDHFLDSAGVVVKPMAGTILFSTVIIKMDPMLAVVLGIIAGGTVAEVIHVKKAALRVGSSTVTAGFANPILSFMEDITAALGISLSVLFPILAVFLVILVIIAGYFTFRALCRFLAKRKAKKAGAAG